MPEQTAAEPSMDDILASIRRIVTDEAPAGEGSVPSAGAATPDPAPTAPAASAFDRLADAAEESAKARAELAMPAAGRTLEDVVRELLRPLLKAWLDEHLPAIVEARVDEEVTRIARGRVR
jgi:cell pole-organizing protein PopZ